MKEYICMVCGYVHETDGELPDDFKCPLCGAGKDAFRLKDLCREAGFMLPQSENTGSFQNPLKHIPTFPLIQWRHY